MTKIRAFVGHSFTGDDADVVRRFGEMFTNLTHVMPEFSWNHAELAKPISISEKVLDLTGDKNVFIAICTRKERVLKELGPLTWARRLGLSEADFQWKTSDWIIQETGLAKGLKLHPIIFVENEVRPPAGLHGDLEWIAFDRNAPEKAFGKFLQMMGTLKDNPGPQVTVEQDAISPPPNPPTEKLTSAKGTDSTLIEPTDTWSLIRFEVAFMQAVDAENLDAQKAIAEAFAKSEFAKTHYDQKTWDAFREATAIEFGKSSNLDQLRKLCVDNPDHSEVRYYLGRALEKFDRLTEAAAEYRVAAQHATGTRKIAYLGDAADVLSRVDHRTESSAVLAEAPALIGHDQKLERQIHEKQQTIAK
jgi:hypothetical protein